MWDSLFSKKSAAVISPAEVKEKMTEGKKFVLLDVRTPQEYKQVHIKGSRLLPVDQLKSKISGVVPDKDTEIVVYCLSGARAGSAASQLSAMGYSKVSNMGGISSWKYEVERG